MSEKTWVTSDEHFAFLSFSWNHLCFRYGKCTSDTDSLLSL